MTVDINTYGKSVFREEPDDVKDISEITSKYITQNTPWILDIDLSFFSTTNPFVSLYKKSKIYPLLEEIFAYKKPENDTEEEIKKAAEYREEQLKELEKIFICLEENRTLSDEFLNSVYYEKIKTMKDKLDEHFPDDQIDWKHLFDAGCVCNNLQLPVHQTPREKVLEFIQHFGKLLDVFACPPTVISMARSCEYDVFVPLKDCNFIEENVVAFLKKSYTCDEPEMPYLDM